MRGKINILLMVLMLCLLTGCSQSEAEPYELSGVLYHSIDSANESEAVTPENDLSTQTGESNGVSSMDVLAACAGTTITQTIENADGKSISINAEVNVDGISRVSCYRYVPQPITDEFREILLVKLHPAETWDVNDAAVYDAEKDVWEFVTPRGESWIYQVRDSQIPGEQIFNHERVDVSLDYSEDNLVRSVIIQEDDMMGDKFLMEITMLFPTDIEEIGQKVIDSVTEADTYSCSYIHIYGNNDRQPFVIAVFKQIIDGMPVTVWHNFSTVAMDDKRYWPGRVWGSFFLVEEVGLDKPILSAQEAVTAMQEQIDSVRIQGDTPTSVTKISLEYLAVFSSNGEPYIVPVWRFLLGDDEKERSLMGEKILAVNAVTGELIWEERKSFTEQR